MAGFDAESCLRLTGERWIRADHGGDHPPWDPVLPAAAAALVAVGAMTNTAARPVIDDYHQALSVRERSHRHRMTEPAPRPVVPAPPHVGQFRVAPCERTVDRLTIHYVAFTDHDTTLYATVDLGEPQHHPSAASLPAHARQLTVTDDRGNTATARYAGSIRRGASQSRARYQFTPLLAADTAWIELLGERIDLTASSPAGIEIRTEPLPAQDPAVRHLWDRVATLNDFHDPHLALDATIAALVAAGALEADAPVIGQARAVLSALRPNDDGTEPDSTEPDSTEPNSTGPEPPDPWPSLLARWHRAGGPVGTIPVGALTPPFDGVIAGVIALHSQDELFSISVELVPDVRTGLPYRDLPDQQHLTWWAADDLGNHYLGEQGSWYATDDWCGGGIGFWPALDPQASLVDLMPTATTERAVIRVPLSWPRRQ